MSKRRAVLALVLACTVLGGAASIHLNNDAADPEPVITPAALYGVDGPCREDEHNVLVRELDGRLYEFCVATRTTVTTIEGDSR